MTDALIILAGGASSRMKKSSASRISDEMIKQANSRSKALILLNDRPMLDYLLYHAKQAGFRKIFLVISKGADLFRMYYGKENANNEFYDLSISYAIQEIPDGRLKPLGTADALYQTLTQYPELKSQQFVVCNCDNLYSIKAFTLLREDANSNAFINYDRDVLKFTQVRIEKFALTKTNDHNYLLDILEKPSKNQIQYYRDNRGKLRVSMNIFKFDGNLFFPYLKSCPMHPIRREKELPTALMSMVKDHPKTVFGIPLSEHVPDLTSKEDIQIMKEYLNKNNIKIDWQ